ncbi:NlpC/P60 family protein [Streptomyces sp. ADMS]|uniref:C40 family peptidase n=1 Tax=Streptomyces sp. ADMS TaxID=3071415 RepID=UPI00296F8F41|nr:NlpC/P60 family protein [Streptomyces sp. ADMS]MDW4906559.1 NlpC/P60 family protein [Streptomyces sp. ADMS]
MAPERTRDDGPSREEVQQRINSLYDQAESVTGTFNATRAMKLGIRRRVTPAPDTARRSSDPTLDAVARPWFDAARAQRGPIVPTALPPDRRPARSPEARPARPASLPAELTARPAPELTARPMAALPPGPVAELSPAPMAELPPVPVAELLPAPVAELPTGPVAALPALPAPRQEVSGSLSTLPVEPSWFPTPSMGAAPLPTADSLPADMWQQSQAPGQGTDVSLDAGTPLYAGTLRDGNYALVTELPLEAAPLPAAAPLPVVDPFPVTDTTYGTGAYFATEPFPGVGTSAGTGFGFGIAFGQESGAKASKAVAFARAQIGRPCVWGAVGPGSYDNSGLIQAAWKAAGVALPRAVHEQASAGVAINLADIRPGDLVFFHGDAGHVGHVGICVGDGTMMHAPRPGATVREDSIFVAGEAAIHSVLRPA